MRNTKLDKTSMRFAVVAALGFLSVSPTQVASTQNSFVMADARDYRHCHNHPRGRTYCHKKDPLPSVWPPFSDRPDHHKWGKKVPCDLATADCADKRDHRSG
jgi:hypothetical protein